MSVPLTGDEYPEWLFWHLMRKPPRIVGRVCQSKTLVDRGDGVAERCKRPVWGDGRVDGEFYGYCSRCWHQYNAFHGHYRTMQANPAAAKLDVIGIQRLTFTERSDKMFDWTLPPADE